jgi:acyl-CoA reductase-like NAD-dependent aldehyde dehydrogenase
MNPVETYKHWINGREVEADIGEYFPVLDPSCGEEIGFAARGNSVDIDHAIQAAQKAFHSQEWQALKPYERARLMWKLAAKVDSEKDRLARLLSLENGKPLRQSYDEVETTVRNFEYYGGWADKVHGRVVPISNEVLDYIRLEPLGVVGHIIPWNYPIDIFSRGVAPCLAVGNTIVAKPAEDTPLSTLEIARMSGEVGFPRGVINVVNGYGKEAGAALARHPGIQGLAFCGSIQTGKEVLRAAAENITPVVSLEMGGKSPLIIFPDADIEKAAYTGAHRFLYNTGQSCGCLSRLLVHRDLVESFAEKIKNHLIEVRAGAWNENADIGPLISSKQLERVMNYIELGRSEGAKLVFGGRRIDTEPYAKGFFIEPTVFTQVKPGMRIVDEEIFGPVLGIISYETEDEAVNIANESVYGLSAEIWTRDISRAHRVAAKLDVSHVTVNGGGGFGIEAPFGGVKQSGFGREGGWESVLQYSRVKNIWINL